jgi:polysaccharide chain length determinant protein (PEP-CTERM system associated)
MQIKELLDQVMDELRGAWRYRWLGLLAAWVVCVVGWLVVYSIPNTYQANARVYVDSKGILRPLLQGLAIDPDVASGLDLVRQVLLSRPQIEQVARNTGLDATAKTPEAREQLINSIQSRISIEAGDLRARTTQGEGLYRIAFQDIDRAKSVEVVQTLLNGFVENALGEKRSGQASAQRFLETQIAQYETRLRESENKLAEFKKRNVGVMPNSQGDYFAKLQEETNGLEQVRTSLGIAESRRTEIQRQLDGEEPFLFGIDSGTSASVAASGGAGDVSYRIQELEKNLEDLLLRYTEKHPEVIATRSTLADLKKRESDELTRVRAGQAATGTLASSLKQNPAYQSLEMELKRTKVQIAELRQDYSQRQARVGDIRGKVNTVPEVEAQLARLNRDYEVNKQQYQELVQRRETAALSENADRSGTVKFEIIDPPAAALEPISPNRPLLLTGVLMAGLGLAGVLAWLLNQLHPVFHSVKTLTAATGVPVLAAVSRTWGERHRVVRKQELLRYCAVAALLVVVFVVVLTFQNAGAQQLQRLIG